MKKVIHKIIYKQYGQIEVACLIRGRPSYKWVPGYATAPNNYPKITRKDAIEEARRLGCVASFKK